MYKIEIMPRLGRRLRSTHLLSRFQRWRVISASNSVEENDDLYTVWTVSHAKVL